MFRKQRSALALTVFLFLSLACMGDTETSQDPENAPGAVEIDVSKLPKTAGTFRTAKTWLYVKVSRGNNAQRCIETSGCAQRPLLCPVRSARMPQSSSPSPKESITP